MENFIFQNPTKLVFGKVYRETMVRPKAFGPQMK